MQPAADGVRLLDEKNDKSYAVIPGDVYLKPGRRVLLKGESTKNDGRTETFTAKTLVRDLGPCRASPSASVGSASSTSPAQR